MNILFYLAFGYITLVGCLSVFLEPSKIHPLLKVLMIASSMLVVIILIRYQVVEKKQKEYTDYIASMERQGIQKEIKSLKAKEKKGLLENSDYLRYISLRLEELSHSLRSIGRAHRRDFILDYFTDVAKIPTYFNFEEWKETEAMIYQKAVNYINADFSARGIANSGMRIKLLEDFKKEREKLVKAKGREFGSKE